MTFSKPDDSLMEWVLIYILVIGLLGMAFLFGLGKVEEATSYGLDKVLENLKSVSGLVIGIKFGKMLQKGSQ